MKVVNSLIFIFCLLALSMVNSGCLRAQSLLDEQCDSIHSITRMGNFESVCEECRRQHSLYDESSRALYQDLPKQEWLKLCAQMVDKNKFSKVRLDSIIMHAEEISIRCSDVFVDSLTLDSCLSNPRWRDNNYVVYISLLCDAMVQEEVVEPFVVDYLLSQITPDMERFMPQSELVVLNYCNLILANVELSLSNVPQSERLIAQYVKKLKKHESRFEAFSSPQLQSKVLQAYYRSFSPLLAARDALDKKTLIDYWHQARAFYDRVTPYCQAHGLEPQLSQQKARASRFPSIFLNRFVMPNDWNLHDAVTDAVADSAILSYRARLADAQLTDSARFTWYYNYQLFQVYMNQTTFRDACNALDTYYNKIPIDTIVSKGLLPFFSNALSTQIFLCDKAQLSDREKRARMNLYCNRVTQMFRYSHRAKLTSVQQGLIALKFLRYWRIYKYLSHEEQMAYFNSIKAYTDVQYFVHSEVVKQLSVILLRGVMDSRKDLLVGLPGVDAVEDLKQKKVSARLFQLLEGGADYFDIGKITMPVVMCNNHRRYVPRERELADMHAERGSQVIKASPMLDAYEDFVLGHHKWYNGMRGFPTWYDNTLSNSRLLVDILTIADGMESSVRNPYRVQYVESYTFDEFLNHLKKWSFTRYNPNLVSLIMGDASLQNQLRTLLEQKRGDIYYDVYRRYSMP